MAGHDTDLAPIGGIAMKNRAWAVAACVILIAASTWEVKRAKDLSDRVEEVAAECREVDKKGKLVSEESAGLADDLTACQDDLADKEALVTQAQLREDELTAKLTEQDGRSAAVSAKCESMRATCIEYAKQAAESAEHAQKARAQSDAAKDECRQSAELCRGVQAQCVDTKAACMLAAKKARGY